MQVEEAPAADPSASRIQDGFSARASHEQARLWFLAQKSPGDTSYNMAYRLAISGEANVEAIETALHRLQKRHEILRTTFELSEGDVRQIVRPQISPSIDHIDLFRSPEAGRLELAWELAREIASQPFDLGAGPLMRCRVIRLSRETTWLVVAMHHIIGDGWSHAVLTRDFCAFYNEAAGGEPETGLPDLAIQFGDFAEWQKDHLSSAEIERQVAFWVDRLDGVPELSLPLDGEAAGDAPAAKLRFSLEADLLEGISKFARDRTLLLSTVWLTACQRALAAMSGQDEFLMGTVVANRPLQDVENLIGFFANTIAIPSVVRNEDPPDVQLEKVQALLLDVQENQQAPFDVVIDRLGYQRRWNANSPVGALFVLQNAPYEAIELEGATVEVERINAGAAKFPFTLFVTEGSGRVDFEIEYAPDLLSARQVRNFSRVYMDLLAGLAGEPAVANHGAPWLLHGERRPEWLGKTVVDLIWESAARAPDEPALIDGDQSWTYAQMIADAERFASDLSALELPPGATVMTVLPRSAALLISVLGILRAGLTWCPADPDVPPDYVAQVIDSARPAAIVSLDPLRKDVQWVRPPERRTEAPVRPAAAFPAPASNAYVFHTSGSTGMPKGVAVRHEGLANVCRWIQQELGLKPGDRGLWKTSITFDAVCRELFPILIGGGDLVVGPPDAQRDMRLLLKTLHDHEVSTLHCVPSQLQGLVGEGRFPASLRAIMSGGEALDGHLASAVVAANPLRLYNVYGPTEATVDVSWYETRGDEPAGPLPIGKPIPNVDLAIFRDDEILPAGFRGEVFIAGVQVASGYIGPDPARRFRCLEGLGRGYATGDVAYVRTDGNIVYEGRGDRQLKFNGVRIEPNMIEAVLRLHESVGDAHVALVDTGSGARKLVALVTPAAEQGGLDEAGPSARAEGWSDVFEDSYADLDYGIYPADNTHGWLDSASREPIPQEEVLDAIEQAAGRILHWKPRRILELGCGIGTLGFRLLPHCEAYQGVDFSEGAVAYARHHAERAGFAHARFDVASAADYSPPPGELFDAIVLNSVVQYLPDERALRELLTRLTPFLLPGGFLFVGDVRDARMNDVFAFWKVRQRATNTDTCASVLLSARMDELSDEELRLAPAFFADWAAGAGFAPPLAQVKTARGDNELVRFRYDVLLAQPLAEAVVEPAGAREMMNGLVAGEAALYRAVAAAPPGRPIRSVQPGGAGDLPTPRDVIDRVDPAERSKLHLCLVGAEPDRFVLASVPASASLAACCKAAAGDDPPSGESSDRGAARWKAFLAVQQSLTAHLADHLPANMLPQHLLPLPAMPLRSNGKRDLATLNLLAAKSQSRAAGRRDLPAEGSVEALVARVFGELLGRTFYLDDNFFFNGGHSLLATQARNRLEQALRRPVPLRDMFEHATPRLLAHALTAARDGQGELAQDIAKRPEGAPLEASHAQRRLWFIEQLGTGTPVYNIAQAVRVNGRVDLDRLDQAVGELCKRHSALRSTFFEQDGVPVVQLLPPRTRGNLEIIDGLMSESAILKRLDEEQRVRFDLTRGPLMRVIAAPTEEGRTILCLICHHIVSDGWSMAVALGELSELYDAAMAGRAPMLDPVRIDYFDVAAHDRGTARNEQYAPQISYWTDQLADAPKRLTLPYDSLPGGRRSWAGDKIRFDISEDLAARVRSLSRAAEVTEFMTLLAAFNVLLRAIGAQDDMVVGTVVANRNRLEIEGLVGFLVNPLGLRLRGNGESSFHDLLTATKRTCIGAFEHQDVPFEVLLEHLNVDRNSDYQAVFQVLFAMQNTPSADMSLAGMSCERLRLPAVGAMFDLSLEVSDRGDGMSAELEFSSELFTRATAERIVANYLQTLKSCLDHPEARVRDIDVIAPAEKQVLDAFATGPDLVPVDGDTLSGRLYDMALRHPQRPALVGPEGEIGFGRLGQLAATIAHGLERAGCGGGDLVAVMLPRGSLAAVGMLGCQWLGASPCYIDSSLPLDRRIALLRECGARWCLVEAPLDGTAEPLSPHCLPIPISLGALGDDEASLSPPRATPAATAFATFTSGTTGAPKLVAVSQGAICARLQANDLLFGEFKESDRFAHCYSFNYDGGIVCLYWPLTRGVPVIFVDLAVLGDAAELGRVIAGQSITIIDSIPAVIGSLYAPDVAGCLAGVRLVLTGGDTCPRDLAERHFEYSDAPIANQYGPCEAVINATTAVYTSDMPSKAPMTIGPPIPGCDVVIADPGGRLVPIGVPGELWIGGPYLADGYVNSPEATAEKFQIRRMGSRIGRFYRSGDRGRWLPSGEIEFLGRADRQIQINGMRVEPGEIENALYEYPGVEYCRVSPMSAGTIQSLVAFVVAQPTDPAGRGVMNDQWEHAFDTLYLPASRQGSPALDFTGWTDTASGDLLPQDQMTVWLDDIVSVVSGLAPRRVLEIGAGLGLIALSLASRVDEYVATDISDQAVRALGKKAEALGLDTLSTMKAAALEVGPKLAGRSFDVIVINSLVQYLASVDELEELIRSLVPLLSDDGHIFVGDVRDYRLRELFYRQVLETRHGTDGDPLRLERFVAQARMQDEELHVAPYAFVRLARENGLDDGVVIRRKPVLFDNELVNFRYDVLLSRRAAAGEAPGELGWSPAVQQGLLTGAVEVPPTGLRLKSAPFLSGGGHQRGAVARARPLVELIETAQAEGWSVDLSVSDEDDRCDVILHPRSVSGPGPKSPVRLSPLPDNAPLANVPTFGAFTQRIREELTAHLRARLPAHMVPASFVILDRLPTRKGGKVDDRLLAAMVTPPEADQGENGGEDLALSIMTEIWRRLIGVQNIPPHADFFSFGGHSLLAAKLVAAIRREFQVDLPVIRIFELRTMARITAATLEVRRNRTSSVEGSTPDEEPQSDLPTIEKLIRNQRSIGRKSLLLAPGERHLGMVLRMRRPLDRRRLNDALEAVAHQHPIIGWRFRPEGGLATEREGRPLLASAPHGGDPLELMAQPLDTLHDGALSFHAVEDGGGVVTLVLRASPLVFDGTSVDLLLREVVREYRRTHLAPPSDRPGSLSYHSWAATEKALGREASPVNGKPRHLERKRAVTEFTLTPAEIAIVDRFAERYTMTVPPYLLGAFAWAAAQTGLADEQLIDCAISDRLTASEGLAGAIGPFASDVPVRIGGSELIEPVDYYDEAADRIVELVAGASTAMETAEPAPLGFSYRLQAANVHRTLDIDVIATISPPWNGLKLSVRRGDDELVARLAFDPSLYDPDAVSRLRNSLRERILNG